MADSTINIGANTTHYGTIEAAREAAKKHKGNEAIVLNDIDKTYSLRKIADTPEQEKAKIAEANQLQDATSDGMEAKGNAANFDPNVVEFSIEGTFFDSSIRIENIAKEKKDVAEVGSKISNTYINSTKDAGGQIIKGGSNLFTSKDDAIAAAKRHEGIEAVVKNADGSFSLYRATKEDVERLKQNPDYKGKVTAFVVPESKLFGLSSSETVIEIPIKSASSQTPATPVSSVPSSTATTPATETPSADTNTPPTTTSTPSPEPAATTNSSPSDIQTSPTPDLMPEITDPTLGLGGEFNYDPYSFNYDFDFGFNFDYDDPYYSNVTIPTDPAGATGSQNPATTGSQTPETATTVPAIQPKPVEKKFSDITKNISNSISTKGKETNKKDNEALLGLIGKASETLSKNNIDVKKLDIKPEDAAILESGKALIEKLKDPNYILAEHQDDLKTLSDINSFASRAGSTLNLPDDVKETLANISKDFDATIRKQAAYQHSLDNRATAINETGTQLDNLQTKIDGMKAEIKDMPPGKEKEALEKSLAFYETELSTGKDLLREMKSGSTPASMTFMLYGTYLQKIMEPGADVGALRTDFDNKCKTITAAFSSTDPKAVNNVIKMIAEYSNHDYTVCKALINELLAKGTEVPQDIIDLVTDPEADTDENQMQANSTDDGSSGGSSTEGVSANSDSTNQSGFGMRRRGGGGGNGRHHCMDKDRANRFDAALTLGGDNGKPAIAYNFTPEDKTDAGNLTTILTNKISRELPAPSKSDLAIFDQYIEEKHPDFKESFNVLTNLVQNTIKADSSANQALFELKSSLNALRESCSKLTPDMVQSFDKSMEEAKAESQARIDESANSDIEAIVANASNMQEGVSAAYNDFDSSKANISDLLMKFREIIKTLDLDTRALNSVTSAKVELSRKFSKILKENRERWDELDKSRKQLSEANKSSDIKPSDISKFAKETGLSDAQVRNVLQAIMVTPFRS